ncbi:MAG: hypothetical protein CMJ64_24850 [Planctomycetaceae bacterium]|nr:hypothetical protein [Planctomycetaceae bacterium]
MASDPPDVTIYAASDSDRLTVERALTVADLNGDGTGDLIVGARYADGPNDSRDGAGEVYVIFGGDFSQRGTDDLLLGTSAGDGPANARNGSGELYVVFGGDFSQRGTIDLRANGQDVTIFGAASNDRLSNSSAVGDVNGDGTDDLILASRGNGPEDNRHFANEISVIFGGELSHGDRIDLAIDPPDVTIFGASELDSLYSATAGDVNGDGTDDLILATKVADGPNESREDAGEAYVIFGTSSPLVVNQQGDIDDGDPFNGETTLREAVNRANALYGRDEIRFDLPAGSIITLAGGELRLTDDVKIIGPGASLLTIDADDKSRIFHVNDDNPTTAIEAAISGLTLTGGTAASTNPTNAEGSGGAIFSLEHLTVSNSIVTGNRAFRAGGGIRSGSDFTTTTGTRLAVANTEITDNHVVDLQGGGISIGLDSVAVISNSEISGNTAGDSAGGISNFGTLTVTNTIISENTAERGGGGIVNITSSAISGNTAPTGGGVYNARNTTITNSTISGNTAESGGGIYQLTPPLLRNTIVAGNRFNTGGQTDIAGMSNVSSISASNLIGSGGSGGLVDGDAKGNLVGPD